MTRLIDADALLEAFKNNGTTEFNDGEFIHYADAIHLITNVPTVQRDGWLSKCRCSLKTKLVGDGCIYCNTQEYIDKLHEDYENLFEENKKLATASTIQREGWVSVPIEPTEEMIEASINSKSPWNIIDAYKAMIQAAPTDKE